MQQQEKSSSFKVIPTLCLEDNFSYLIVDVNTECAAVGQVDVIVIVLWLCVLCVVCFVLCIVLIIDFNACSGSS